MFFFPLWGFSLIFWGGRGRGPEGGPGNIYYLGGLGFVFAKKGGGGNQGRENCAVVLRNLGGKGRGPKKKTKWFWGYSGRGTTFKENFLGRGVTSQTIPQKKKKQGATLFGFLLVPHENSGGFFSFKINVIYRGPKKPIFGGPIDLGNCPPWGEQILCGGGDNEKGNFICFPGPREGKPLRGLWGPKKEKKGSLPTKSLINQKEKLGKKPF